jgi:chloride channel 3/4/5
VLVNGNAILHGYLTQGELNFAIHEEGLLKDDEAVEMFGKLGLRHSIVVEEGTGKVVGAIIKKQSVLYLEGLHYRYGVHVQIV